MAVLLEFALHFSRFQRAQISATAAVVTSVPTQCTRSNAAVGMDIS